MENNRNLKLSWTAVLMIIAALTLVAFLVANALHGSHSDALRTATGLSITNTENVQVTDESILYYDGSVLHALSSSGSQRWTFSAGVDADYDASETGVAVWSGSRLSFINGNTGKTLYTGTMTANVLSAKIGSAYAAILLAPEHSSTILLVETGGRQIDEISLPNQTVLDYGFFSTRDLFWVLSLDSSGTTPTCTLSTYRPGKKVTGMITDTDQILYQVSFQSSQICAVGTTYLKVYDYTCVEQTGQRRLVYGWYLADVDKASTNPLMLFVPSSQYDGTPTISDVRMLMGTTEHTVRLPFPCFAVVARGSTLYGFSQEYVMTCKMGQLNATTYKMPIVVDTVIGVTSDGVAVVGSGSMTYLVKLPL